LTQLRHHAEPNRAKPLIEFALRKVAESKPNDLRGRSALDRSFREIVVLGHDDAPVNQSERPDFTVRRGEHSKVEQVVSVVSRFAQPNRQTGR